MADGTLKTVMISSTAKDLPEHREQARLGCLRVEFNPDGMMEHLTASDADAKQVSLEMVEKADVYICILAYRYGFEPPGEDISITEMEYNRAVELGKPRLVFFIHEDHSVKGGDVETGSGAAKLQALKDRIGVERVAAFFKSPEDLRGHIVEALSKLAKRMAEAAGEDASARAQAKLTPTISVPEPPTPFIAHPYTLLQARELVGRQAELNLLTDWVADPSKPVHHARVLSLVAIGGMGKSALTWMWFNDIAPNEMAPLAGRLWWSFYESDAGFENFLTQALIYTRAATPDEARTLPWAEKEMRLLQVLQREPYLLVLDGFERAMRAYHRMDAAHLADDELDQQTANQVAGAYGLPESAGQSFVGQHTLRQTTDPRAGAFLRKLAATGGAARVLITTRLYPSALQLPTGQPMPGCFAVFLKGLSEDDAMELWRALGVSGSRAELGPIFQSVEAHPLLIQALAAEVAGYRRAPGDFAEWRAAHPDFDPTGLPLAQSRTHILHYALQGLSAAEQRVLETITAFRMPASYETIQALALSPAVKPKHTWTQRLKALFSDQSPICSSVGELDRVLTVSQDRGLVGWDRQENRYDLHPIVRGVVWGSAGEASKTGVLRAMEAHFEPMDVPEWQQVESLADLAPAIERYHTLLGLGRFDDACDLFYDRLERASLFRLAAHRERIAWLEPLFPAGPDRLPALASERDQAHTLNALALSYDLSGEPSRAAPLYRLKLEIDERAEDRRNLAVGLVNLGDCLTAAGGFREAEAALRRALTLTRELEDAFHEAVSLQLLGHLAAHTGQTERSQRALERSRDLFIAQNHKQFEGVATADLAERALWLGEHAAARDLAATAWELAHDRRHERDFIRAALLQGQAALGLGDHATADERLHHALTRARAVNMVEYELPALIALARLAVARDDPAAARAHLTDADVFEPARRGPYPCFLADAHNTLAAIERAAGNPAAAIAAATEAYKAAWCDGPPWAYHWGLEAARAHLHALGASEPDLPPFNEADWDDFPDVPLIPLDEDDG